MEPTEVTFNCEFSKASTDGGYVRGWASVVVKGGKLVSDWEGDVIGKPGADGKITNDAAIGEIRKAFHNFITSERQGRVEHGGKVIGEVVECLIIDDDVAKALGIADQRRGAFIGMRVYDEEVKKGVRAGIYKGFSIRGKGSRLKVAA